MRNPGRVWCFSLVGLLATGCVGVNVFAYRQAFALTHYSRSVGPTIPSLRQVLFSGYAVPRPENDRSPKDFGLPFKSHTFTGAHGLEIEAWMIDAPDSRGTVILFHGNTASKSVLLPEAEQLLALGYSAFLVDFHGAGGSRGDDTSLGVHESQDVGAAFRYVESLRPGRPIILYGISMGAVAVLRAVAEERLAPAALILQAPFDRLVEAARRHVRQAGLPAFPIALLLVFWGGIQLDADLFAHNPIEYASRVDRPTLLMVGRQDPFVSRSEAEAILEQLKGPRAFSVCEGVGHASCFAGAPKIWARTVASFLKEVVPAKAASRQVLKGRKGRRVA